MKLAIIGNRGNHSTEGFYASAFSQLGHRVQVYDQYAGATHTDPYRLLLSRIGGFERLRELFPINATIQDELRRTSPDLVLVFKGDALSTTTLQRVSSEYASYLFY